jgi:hypothetical protein
VPGSSFIDVIELFEADPETELIVLSGEIGGDAEEEAADYIAESVSKPVLAYIAGFTAPAGQDDGPRRSHRVGLEGNRRREGRGPRGQGREGRASTRPRSPRSPSRSWARASKGERLAIVAGPVAELTNISLARGAPSLDIIAVDDLKAAAQTAFERDPAGTFAYGTSAGYPRLVEWIAKKHGVHPDRVIATNGSMQADAFLFQKLVQPGDLVVVEAPTYDRTLLALRQLGAEILAIPLEADGIDVDALEIALEEGARPEARAHHPQLPEPGRLHAVAGEAPEAPRPCGRARVHRVRGRPVRRAPLSRASRSPRCCRWTRPTPSCTRRRSPRRSAPGFAWATWSGRRS